MCGVAGAAAPDAGAVAGMLARLAHRGPGERRVVVRDGAALGLARLHVTTPDAPSGPYVTADGAVAASVNGEIWNHGEIRRDLASRGIRVPDGADTAVVAPLWAADGIAGIAKLRGMFAAVIHDARDGALVLVRDRFGIKPLFFRPGPPFLCASEPAALGAAGRLDPSAIEDYLVLGTVPAPATIRSDVRQVEPGTVVVHAGSRTTVTRWGSPPLADPSRRADPGAIRDALGRAVVRHRMGDLPAAVFVSGGLDSALLAALAARTGPPPRLLALTFPGEGEYDEAPAARAVAAHLGLPLREVPLGAADVPDLLAAVVRAHGPFADASALAAHALCRGARDVAGVVLSGTGADELFAGYRRYRLDRLSGPAAAAARAAAAVLPASRRTRLGTLGALARKAVRAGAGADDAARYAESLAVVPCEWRRRLLGTAPRVPAPIDRAFARGGTFADRARAADLATYLPDDVLAKEDRAAAAVGMENRVPYLDDEVADLAGGAPAAAHLRCGSVRGPKASLRAAAAGLLPDRIRNRPKRGFGVPVSEWMRGPLARVVEEHLGDPGASVGALLDPVGVTALVAAHRRGDDDLGSAVWALVVLEAALRGEGSV